MPLKPGTLRRFYFSLAITVLIVLCAVALVAGPLASPYDGSSLIWVIAIPITLGVLIALGLVWVAWRWR